MTPLDVAGRAGDLAQLALGAAVLRPALRRLPGLVARTRHEPFAARGEAFVRGVGALEKAVFVAKMLGTDGAFPAPGAVSTAEDDAGPDTLLFAGDVLFPGALGPDSLSHALRSRIARASCFAVNVEGTLADRAHEIAPLLTVRGIAQLLAYERDPTNADWASRLDVEGLRAVLSDARRALAGVANNHTLDDGEPGFDRTIALLRGLGIDVVGDARSDDGAAIVDVGPHRVGVLAVSYGSNQLGAGSGCHVRFDDVPYRIDRGRIAAIVDRLRARGATHVVASLHWGHEHEHEPSAEQRRTARDLFDEGVAAIIGHHPHLVQRSEAHAGHWVSYSLGDFIGGDRTIWSRFGVLASLSFERGGAVRGELVPVVQTPFWAPHRTMLLDEAPAFERAVFARCFAAKIPSRGSEGRR